MITTLNELNDLIKKSYKDAFLLVLGDPASFAALFESDDDLVGFAEYEYQYNKDIVITSKILYENLDYFCKLIKSADALIKIASMNFGTVSLLIYSSKLDTKILFRNPNDLIRLAAANSGCAMDVINQIDPKMHLDALNDYFKNSTISSELLNYAAMTNEPQLTCTFLKFFQQKNINKDKFSELLNIMEANPCIAKQDIVDIKRKFGFDKVNSATMFYNRDDSSSHTNGFIAELNKLFHFSK